ncbi:MAG: HAD family hydrolase [Gemmataceae bacterium]
MSLTLEQYAADYLPGRGLPWPAAPKPVPLKAKAHVPAMKVKIVFWTADGTLLSIPHGELRYEHEHEFVTEAALDKTLKEFNMWNSMIRKPGAPAALLKEMFNKALTQLRMAGSGTEKFPEFPAEKIWDDIVSKLEQREYKYDLSIYGPRPEFLRKLTYFYHASIQGVGAYAMAADVTRQIFDRGILNGLLTDGQSFLMAQLRKSLREQDESFEEGLVFPGPWRVIGIDRKARKPSETLFKAAVDLAGTRGWKPADILHVGSRLTRDIAPAKKFGMRTVLFAGDKNSLEADAEQLKHPTYRPDGLITDLSQLLDALE